MARESGHGRRIGNSTEHAQVSPTPSITVNRLVVARFNTPA
jgi:hypothetical protein